MLFIGFERATEGVEIVSRLDIGISRTSNQLFIKALRKLSPKLFVIYVSE